MNNRQHAVVRGARISYRRMSSHPDRSNSVETSAFMSSDNRKLYGSKLPSDTEQFALGRREQINMRLWEVWGFLKKSLAIPICQTVQRHLHLWAPTSQVIPRQKASQPYLLIFFLKTDPTKQSLPQTAVLFRICPPTLSRTLSKSHSWAVCV